MKPWGYGVVALVMADAWGEEVTQHVRRGHIFGASPPSVAANICFCLGDHQKIYEETRLCKWFVIRFWSLNVINNNYLLELFLELMLNRIFKVKVLIFGKMRCNYKIRWGDHDASFIGRLSGSATSLQPRKGAWRLKVQNADNNARSSVMLVPEDCIYADVGAWAGTLAKALALHRHKSRCKCAIWITR